MNMKYKIISEKKIYKGKIFDINQLNVTLPDDRARVYDVLETSNACAVLALDDKDNIVLITQYRPSAGKIMLEIPAGKIDEGEKPETCAVRELKEETGYTAGKIEKMFSMYVSPGYSTEIIHIYKATKLTLGTTDFDEDEFIETTKIPLKDAIEMIENGDIEDAKTISAILAVK